MKRKTNKLLAYLLVLVMALSSSVTVFAEGTATISGNDVIEDTQEPADDSVSSNDVTEETGEDTDEIINVDQETEEAVSDNDLDAALDQEGEKEADSEDMFPGLPANYTLSAEQLSQKESLRGYLDQMNDAEAGVDYVENEVFFSCSTREEAELYAEAFGAELKSYFDNVAVLCLPEGVTVTAAVRASANMEKHLPAVSPNYYRYPMNSGYATASYDDPMLQTSHSGYQWHHQVVGSVYAWDNGYKGAGVKVAVLDSGISPHEDLEIADSYNAAAGATSGTVDENGHGTHVGGIIAARHNNGTGGSGVAPEAALYNIKVLGQNDEEAGTTATLVRGINKAIEWQVDIINMSLGGYGGTPAEEDAVNRAVKAGIAVFVAAGNDGSLTACFPGAYEKSICVAATDTNNAKAYFSNYGPWVDLAAPGVNICSTVPDGYGFMSGTSQATPVAAGTAAVILSAKHPSLYRDGVALTGEAKVAALEQIMKGNVAKASGSKIGSGITTLPKALKLSTIAGTPNTPVFSKKAGTYSEESMAVEITAESGMEIWYSIDGKTPSYKNGQVKNGTLYTGPVTVSGQLNGKVTGKMTLKAIAVNASGKSSKVTSATYTFKPKVTGIAISGLKKVPRGKSITLKAVVTPSWAAVKKVKWSISGTGVSINATSGKVTASSSATPGIYTVTAEAKDGSGVKCTWDIEVLESAQVDKMTFSEKSQSLTKGSDNYSVNLSDLLSVLDKGGNKLPVSEYVTWSSSKVTVATVDETGVVYATGSGRATITASAADGSGKKATINIVVVQDPESLTINGSGYVAKGKSISLKADIGPAMVKDKTVEWSISGDSAATGVSISKGKVTVKKDATAGIYTVTAKTKNGITATKEIEVTEEAIQSMKFKTASVNLFRVAGKGNAATSADVELEVKGSYSAEFMTITNSAPGIVTCELTNNILTVRATGKTTGKAVITVKATDGSNKSAKCTVNVSNPASNLTISPEAGRVETISKGKKLKLSGVLETEFGSLTAAGKKIKWSSSNEAVATVNAKGVVTAKAGLVDRDFGTATITAETLDGSGLVAEYTIHTAETTNRISVGRPDASNTWDEIDVNRIAVYDIYFNGKMWYEAGVWPEVSVEVSDPTIVSAGTTQVEGEAGLLYVFPLKKGTVTITVKTIDGSGKKATVKLFVK